MSLGIGAAMAANPPPPGSAPPQNAIAPADALKRLMEGNARYAANAPNERDFSAGRAARGGGFHLPAARAQAAAPSMAPTAAASLLGLQQSWSPAEQDDAAQRRGHALLEELAAMQRDMLRGRLDASSLSRLAAMAEGEAGHDAARLGIAS